MLVGFIAGFRGRLVAVGEFTEFAVKTIGGFFASLIRPRTWRLLPPQMYIVGVLSVPVVVITGVFVGMVLAVQAYAQFASLGMESHLGILVNVAVVRELGPVLAATMLAGRVGGAVTAELGTMRVTEQIDALRVMGTDPIRYLSVPRFWSCFLMVPVLTAYTDITGILGGWLVAVKIYNVPAEQYTSIGFMNTELWDLSTGLAKSFFFGATIGLFSCYKGFTCGPGAGGVGKACTEAFVLSFVAILVENFLLAIFFKEIYDGIWGYRPVL
jgi:phospholipid/cholesterol/gamma-HCH transport system permease protein